MSKPSTDRRPFAAINEPRIEHSHSLARENGSRLDQASTSVDISDHPMILTSHP